MSYKSDDDDVRTTIKLVASGDSPRSIRVVANIKKALVAAGVDPRRIETVDVMTERERILDRRTVAV